MFIYLNKRGQSTLEYGIIIAVVVAALIAMQTYLKRGLQGKLRESADDIGKQFSPGYTTANYTTVSNSSSTENITVSNVAVGNGTEKMSQSHTDSSQDQTRDGTENVAVSNNEYWK